MHTTTCYVSQDNWRAFPCWCECLKKEAASARSGSDRPLLLTDRSQRSPVPLVALQMGRELGKRFAPRLTWWVRSFIFGLEEAAKYPFVLGLEGLNEAKEVQGGKFLAEAIAKGQGKL
jgi:hypothetical protein